MKLDVCRPKSMQCFDELKIGNEPGKIFRQTIRSISWKNKFHICHQSRYVVTLFSFMYLGNKTWRREAKFEKKQ